jgi:protein-L-isoaspartate(D-aspartate) O-methyltransferase
MSRWSLMIAVLVCSASFAEPSHPRRVMVEEQLRPRGIRSDRVLAAMGEVPRHLFVPPGLARFAYDDRPLPIGHEQTISQPYIVAFMADVSGIQPGDKVLEVGTGSGYQAAVLARLGKEVYTIEIVQALGEQARARLAELGFKNVHVRIGDGYRGWPEAAPFDVIHVTAAPDHVPQPLIDQLRVGGRMIIPVGTGVQELVRLTKTPSGVVREKLMPVRFVPLTGQQAGPPTPR